MRKRELPSEFKWGMAILSPYLAWALGASVASGMGWKMPPESNIKIELIPPFTSHEGVFYLLGTDIYGRSVASLLSEGVSYSLTMALMVGGLCLVIGLVFGHLAATGPRPVRFLLDLAINLVFIFPGILIAILIMSLTGKSQLGLIFALVITGWPAYAKLARVEIQRVMGLPFIESQRAVGANALRIFFSGIMPNIMPVMLVHLVLGLSGVIISEAVLGFLGLGGSQYSWGSVLAMAKSVLLEAPYLVIILALALAFFIIGLNLVGDGLRDYLDPNSQKK